MTTAEKIHVLEEIWDNLCQTPEDVPSPGWHEQVLRDREERVREGSASFTDWPQAKREIRDGSQ
jgi:hypothetical protein